MEKSEFQGGGEGGVNEKPIFKGIALKGGLRQFADLRGGGLARKRGLVFLRGLGLIPQCTMLRLNLS